VLITWLWPVVAVVAGDIIPHRVFERQVVAVLVALELDQVQ